MSLTLLFDGLFFDVATAGLLAGFRGVIFILPLLSLKTPSGTARHQRSPNEAINARESSRRARGGKLVRLRRRRANAPRIRWRNGGGRRRQGCIRWWHRTRGNSSTIGSIIRKGAAVLGRKARTVGGTALFDISRNVGGRRLGRRPRLPATFRTH